MEDIPQPKSDSYTVGDQVKIYIKSDDPDSRYHGVVCEIQSVRTDDLGVETGRSLDVYSYTVQEIQSGDELPISFRHRDLVPVEDIQ